MGQRTALDGLHVVAEAADDLDDLSQLAGFVVQCEQQREAVAHGGLFTAEDDEAGGVVAVGVDAGDEDFQPVEGGCLGAGDGGFGRVARLSHELAAMAVLGMAVAGRRNCFKNVSLWAMAC